MNRHFDTEAIKCSVDTVDLISIDESLEESSETYRNGHESSHPSKSRTCLDVSPRSGFTFVLTAAKAATSSHR